jgi:DNA repair protein RadD
VYSQLEAYRSKKGYAKGWLSHKYKEYFGVWPVSLNQVSAPITHEISNWILSRQIAYAKANDGKPRQQSWQKEAVEM